MKSGPKKNRVKLPARFMELLEDEGSIRSGWIDFADLVVLLKDYDFSLRQNLKIRPLPTHPESLRMRWELLKVFVGPNEFYHHILIRILLPCFLNS